MSMYSARCSEIWGSLATPIVKKILYFSLLVEKLHVDLASFMLTNMRTICTCKIQHASKHLTVIGVKFIASTVTDESICY